MNDLTTLTSLPSSPARANLAKYKGKPEYLRRIQLVTKGKYVDKNKIPAGNFGIPGKDYEITDLGDEIDVLVLAMRDKALDTSGETAVVSFDPTSEVFQDIEARSSIQDSRCMAGPSFLMFERSTGELLEYHCNNKSAQQEAPKFAEFLPVSDEDAAEFGIEAHGPLPMTLCSKYVDPPGSPFAWYVPVAEECTTPFNNVPPTEELSKAIIEFVNPKEEAPEMADSDARSR